MPDVDRICEIILKYKKLNYGGKEEFRINSGYSKFFRVFTF
jgi:hypothetical protein